MSLMVESMSEWKWLNFSNLTMKTIYIIRVNNAISFYNVCPLSVNQNRSVPKKCLSIALFTVNFSYLHHNVI